MMQKYEQGKTYSIDGVQRLVIGFDGKENPITTTNLDYKEQAAATATATGDSMGKVRELLAAFPLEKLNMEELLVVAAVLGIVLPDGTKDDKAKAIRAV